MTPAWSGMRRTKKRWAASRAAFSAQRASKRCRLSGGSVQARIVRWLRRKMTCAFPARLATTSTRAVRICVGGCGALRVWRCAYTARRCTAAVAITKFGAINAGAGFIALATPLRANTSANTSAYTAASGARRALTSFTRESPTAHTREPSGATRLVASCSSAASAW